MLTLNLLPPKEKHELVLERNRRFALFAGGSSFVVLLIFALLLFSAKRYIEIQLEPLKKDVESEQKHEEAKRTQELEREIQNARDRVSRVVAIQSAALPWSSVLKDISLLPLEGITFSSVAFTKSGDERLVRLVGHADDRDRALLGLERAIEDHPQFFDLDSPNTNRIKEHDINFVISFNVRN